MALPQVGPFNRNCLIKPSSHSQFSLAPWKLRGGIRRSLKGLTASAPPSMSSSLPSPLECPLVYGVPPGFLWHMWGSPDHCSTTLPNDNPIDSAPSPCTCNIESCIEISLPVVHLSGTCNMSLPSIQLSLRPVCGWLYADTATLSPFFFIISHSLISPNSSNCTTGGIIPANFLCSSCPVSSIPAGAAAPACGPGFHQHSILSSSIACIAGYPAWGGSVPSRYSACKCAHQLPSQVCPASTTPSPVQSFPWVITFLCPPKTPIHHGEAWNLSGSGKSIFNHLLIFSCIQGKDKIHNFSVTAHKESQFILESENFQNLNP